jgi:ferritin-like metal-binding protein YciE
MKKQSNDNQQASQEGGLETKLGKLFEDSLRDIYWAEKALVKALPRLAKNATSSELVEAIEKHLAETEQHVERAQQIFEVMGKEPRGKKCEGMQGLIDEADTLMKDAEEGVMRDAAIISAAQKVEHYEISAYGTLRTFAQTLGLQDAVSILEKTLEEEKMTDTILTELAEANINLEAASEQEGDE